jgi:probable FeS assembly SUF system protein SufT
MAEQRTVVTTRDVQARLVPSGMPVQIPGNSFVNLKQALGGTYTVTFKGNMARIDAMDADALGFEPARFDFPARADGSVHEDDIWQALRTVYDPEIPFSIVDLGLVYGVQVARADGRNTVQIRMTLTAPTCGMGPVLVGDVEYRVRRVPNVDEVRVELVFDPPWSREHLPDEIKLEMGLPL